MQANHRSGQIGLVLLIVMGVVVSLVLSIASRVLTDTTLSRQERENNASFAIAQSGVERALLGLAQGDTTAANVPLTDTANLITGNYGVTEERTYDMYLKEGEVAQIDLTGTPSPTSFTIRWNKPGEDPGGACTNASGGSPAAIEVAVFDDTGSVVRSYYNSSRCSSQLGSINNFAASTAITGDYESSQDITFPAGQAFARIKTIYTGSTVNVQGPNLGPQLYLIESHAEGGDAQSDIQAVRSLPAAQSVFDFALFSNTTITKP